MAIFFNKENHQYITSQGVILPSVTQIIRNSDDYYQFNSGGNTEARERGELVHELLYQSTTFGGLFDSTDGAMGWYLKKWSEIKTNEGIIPICGEKIVGSEQEKFAGRYDLKAKKNGKNVLIDFKTGKTLDKTYTAIQLSAYSLFEKDVEEIWAVCINPNVNKKGYRVVQLDFKTELFMRLKKEFERRDEIILPF